MERTYEIAPPTLFNSVFPLALTAVFLAAEVPKSLKSRFVIGDPVWRELPVRDDLQT